MIDLDLFTLSMEDNLKETAPLADRMRPTNLDEFVGQDHILGQGMSLYRAIKADRINSMIFYGPPGTGKTTLAMIIANQTKMRFEKLSAVTAGVKDIREVVSNAQESLKMTKKRTILFVDEIHRFNKSQQDALLPFVERGIIILIGATTENPFFEVNKALLSRTMVIVLQSLKEKDLEKLYTRALQDEKIGLGRYKVVIDPDAKEYLFTISQGDGRILLNSLEIGVLSTDPDSDGVRRVNLDSIKESIQVKTAKYDKGGDEHYSTISAFIKSMRGSDPNATMYYLAKMINAGEDPKFIARRIVICASEDVGNADPQALVIANSAFQAITVIGMPEGRIILSQAALYVACAPKSNSAIIAIDKALEDIRNEQIKDVPKHLQDGHYSGSKSMGIGVDYKYPHDFENHYVNQNYLPKGMEDRVYYEPSNMGYERKIKERLDWLKGK